MIRTCGRRADRTIVGWVRRCEPMSEGTQEKRKKKSCVA
jgi:hypothetical protein